MPMHLGHIELFVADPLASREFYEKVLGFEVVAVQGRHIWLKLGTVEVLMRTGAGTTARDYGSAGTGLVLYTDDLAATGARLKERGLTFSGTDGSEKCLTFCDPDGHWFQLVNPNDH